MAGTSLFVLLDDIAALLDDVAVMTKLATKKSAGVLGDDLALNAEQVAGVAAERELLVVWAVAKGSVKNKVILVPVALVLSSLLPWAVTPLLMFGGGFLCFEGFEKVAHKLVQPKQALMEEKAALSAALQNPKVDLVDFEAEKIAGAVRTDFILSAEIMVISLGAMAGATLGTRIAALSVVAVLMTVFVYGLVAGIVKLDDAGLALSKRSGFARSFGQFLLWAAPSFLKLLSFGGTIAMFLVGGGILTHGLPPIERWLKGLAADAGSLGWLVSTLGDGLVGLVAGAIIAAVVLPIGKLFKKKG